MPDLKEIFLGLTIAVIAFSVLWGVSRPYVTTTSRGPEWFNSTSEGDNITVSNYPVLDDSETITAYNVSDGSSYGTLTKGTNYSVNSYDEGSFYLYDFGAASSANVTFEYKSHAETYVEDSMSRMIVRYIPVFGAVALLSAMASLL